MFIDEDERLFEIIKSEVKTIKDAILNNYLNLEPDFAYYYADRYKLIIEDVHKTSDSENTNHNWEKIFENDLGIFHISLMNTLLKVKGNIELQKERIEKYIIVFEILLQQKYFLKTRDSYIDNHIRMFNSAFKSTKIEQNLREFIEILREVQFIKDEGGNYKLFNSEELINFYDSLNSVLELKNISSNFDLKSSRALEMFNVISSTKRERTTLRLTYLMVILNIVIIIDILITLFLNK